MPPRGVPDRAALTGLVLAGAVAGVDLDSCDDHTVLETVADWERVIAWASARQLAAAAEFARRPARVQTLEDDPAAVLALRARPGHHVREFADEEIAARLRISRIGAANRLELGCALVGLPATRAALDQGRIDVPRARVLASETAVLGGEAARQVEAALIDRATRLNASRLRGVVKAAVLAADADAAHRRCTRAQSDRRVIITPTVDGMAEVYAHLPAIEAIALDAALSAVARAGKTDRAPGDDRTMDQRRADALVAPFIDALATGTLAAGALAAGPLAAGPRAAGPLAAGTLAAGALAAGALGAPGRAAPAGSRENGRLRLGKHRGQIAEVQVTVAASTLLGQDDAPAQLRGYGPITAQTARELTEDARLRRLLTDPVSGSVLDVGTTVYTPPASLARHVVARSVRCTFPDCGWPAAAADLDHTIAFPQGPTSAANLGPRCRRHHRFKHSPSVRVEQCPDGTTTWTLPTGHVYEVSPPVVGIPIARLLVDPEVRADGRIEGDTDQNTGRATGTGADTHTDADADADAHAGAHTDTADTADANTDAGTHTAATDTAIDADSGTDAETGHREVPP